MLIALVYLLVRTSSWLLELIPYVGTIIIMLIGISIMLTAIGIRLKVSHSIISALRWIFYKIIGFWSWIVRQFKKLYVWLRNSFYKRMRWGMAKFLALMIVLIII